MCDTSVAMVEIDKNSSSTPTTTLAMSANNCVSTSASVETRNSRRSSPAILDSGYGSACATLPVDNSNLLINSDSSFKKRERTQNWNQEEKEYLLELCRYDVQVIENKRYDARHTEAKAKVWQFIHKRFSAQFGVERSVNRLKEQWRRMKAAARSEMQEYKKRQAKVGAELAENKKPSNFTFKVFNLLEDASRLCEMELPINKSFGSDISETNAINSTSNPTALIKEEQKAVIAFKKENSMEPVLKMDIQEQKPKNSNNTNANAETKTLGSVSTTQRENKMDTYLDFSETDSYDSDETFFEPSVSDNDCLTVDKNKSPSKQRQKLNHEVRLFRMKRKEHALHMKLLRAQLKQIVRSGELLESCKLVLDTNSTGPK